jgi:ribosomal protein L37AE/L43A
VETINIDVDAWVNDYINKHKCGRCKGTGVVGKAPWLYTCEDCRQTGLDGYHHEPTFMMLFTKVKNATNMDEIRRIVFDFQCQFELSRVFEGKTYEEWFIQRK